ncbi:macrophage expressed 1, tandem duplicate 3 [Danio aesculapii]|uniref:macrophage expressed 1, tandem duplicate 3 n=1 Tax=Danio aesculapii TaxID=1142201 RepID=UPI0024C0D774|nr:macrophage expressed 1, tandem duplicate 3 [Danio aesculapii]
MESRAFGLLMLCYCMNFCNLYPLIRPSNGLIECHKNSNLVALEVLPGGGWDNLRNKDMGRVMNLSYSLCQTTEDGVYLIPDDVFVVPQKENTVETNSEIIMSWMDQTSSTSNTVNAESSFFSVLNGKFSAEHQRMKTHQVKESSITARVQVRNHLYTVKAYPNFHLDSNFAQQVEGIADAIKDNQTRLATYLSEKLILDYGTHVITSVEAGASLVQEDYLKMTYILKNQLDLSSVSASAGFNFFDKVKLDPSYSGGQKASQNSGYQGNITYSLIQSHGGALFYPGMTLQKWQESTLNNLVAIDRSGLPLHFFLNPTTFPDIPKPVVHNLALLVSQAAEQYYKVNTIPGCVNVDSKNFNFQANVDDMSCEGPITNLSFGGIYQQCTPLTVDGNTICDEMAQKNPATGGYSCSQQYNTTLLRSEIIERGYTRYECQNNCRSCGFLGWSTCCSQICNDVYYVRRAKVDTLWCSSTQKIPEYSGYLFGGLYGPSIQNPFTRSYTCPPNFFVQTILSKAIMVCLSNDYVKATKSAVPFGGFFSCQSGNPLSNSPSRCPPQFSQHLAAISDGCQVLYCVQSGVFSGGQLKPVHLPPYTSPPLVGMTVTNTVVVMTEGNASWLGVGQSRIWQPANPVEINQAFERSGGNKAGVTYGLIALIALVMSGSVVLTT